MILWDVNLWVYAFRKDSPTYDTSREVILKDLEGRDLFLFCPHVAASFLRLVTNSRIFKEPSSLMEAWEYVDFLESHPNARYVDVDRTAFGIFKHISLIHRAGGNFIPDALLAALAIRHDATFVTADRGFKKYPGLKVCFI